MENKTKYKFGFAIGLLVIGILLNLFNVGKDKFFNFASIGNWLIYISFVMIGMVILHSIKKKRIVDERMLNVAAKANRVTFLFIILAAFSIMVIDGINPITIAYHKMMSYFICGIMLVYIITYKIMLKYF